MDSSEGLLEGLRARSYKGEIILSTFMNNWVEMVLQQWASMQRLGMGHLLTLGLPDRKACEGLQAIIPEIGCGYMESMVHYWPDSVYQVWVIRHMVAARMARMGYNVLALDGDILFINDPYRYLKQPPFNEYELIVHQEGGWGLNCGAYYIQNAAPSSPAVYFISEVVDRSLRHKDDEYKWMKQHGYNWQCVLWEQEEFNDVFFAMLMGAPVLGWTAVQHCRLPEVDKEVVKREADYIESVFQSRLKEVGASDTYFDMMGAAAAPTNSTTSSSGGGYAWWRDMQRDAASPLDGFTTKVAPIMLPRANWTVPDGFPGRHTGPGLPRGRFASLWREMLINASSTQMWPDPEDPDSINKATPEQLEMLTVTHKLLQAPQFLFSSWALGSHLGLWTNHTLSNPMVHGPYANTTTIQAAIADLDSPPQRVSNTAHVGPRGSNVPEGLYVTSTTVFPGNYSVKLIAQQGPHMPWFHSLGSHQPLSPYAAKHMANTGHLPLPPRLAMTLSDPLPMWPPPVQRTRRNRRRRHHRTTDQPHQPHRPQQQRHLLETRARRGHSRMQPQRYQPADAPQTSRPAPSPPHKLVTTTTALGHVTAVPFSPHITKNVLMRYLDGQFDWHLHEEARGAAGQPLYYSSTPDRPVPKLVAYHPGMPLHLCHNLTAFQTVLRGLAQVGVLLNRTVLWPDIPCTARWISKGGPQHLFKVPYEGTLETLVQPYGRLGLQRCFNQRYSDVACLKHGRGMVEAEYSHLLSSIGPDGAQAFVPSAANVILQLQRKWTPAERQEILDRIKARDHAAVYEEELALKLMNDGVASVPEGFKIQDPRVVDKQYRDELIRNTNAYGMFKSVYWAWSQVDVGMPPDPDLLDQLWRVDDSLVLSQAKGMEDQPIVYVVSPVEIMWTDKNNDDKKQAYQAFQASCPALGHLWDKFEGPHPYTLNEGEPFDWTMVSELNNPTP